MATDCTTATCLSYGGRTRPEGGLVALGSERGLSENEHMEAGRPSSGGVIRDKSSSPRMTVLGSLPNLWLARTGQQAPNDRRNRMQKQNIRHKRIDAVILVSQKYKKNIYVDDLALKTALKNNGYAVEIIAWDDEGYDFSRARLAIIRSCWDYDQRVDEFLQKMRNISQYCKLINSLAVITDNSNKYYLRDLESKGIRIVPVAFVENIGQVITVLRGLEVKQIVIKPVVSASGRDTYLVNREDEDSVIEVAAPILRTKGVMLQPYISTIKTLGEKSTVVIDGTPVYTMLKKPAEGNFLVHQHHGGTYVETQIGAEEQEFVKQIISTFTERPVYMRIDYLFDEKEEPMLLELELIEPNLYLSKSELALKGLTEKLAEIINNLL